MDSSPSLHSSIAGLSRPENVSTRALEALSEKRRSLPSVFRLLSEANQFQVSLTEELRSFLDCTANMFPASSAVSNSAVQGEVTVIGVMGGQDSGKSTLLNVLSSCASPLFLSPPSSAPTSTIPFESTSVLDFLAMHAAKPSTLCEPTRGLPPHSPFTVNPVVTHLKTLVSSHKNFSIDMAVVQRPNGRVFESPQAMSFASRANASDCFILLEIQSLPTASMLSLQNRGDVSSALASDVRNQDSALQLLSLHIGLFVLSVCNTVVVVDDAVCNVKVWKHLKTLEMLKWNFPELSELFHSSPNLSLYIPILRNSFIDARKRETYEAMMLEMVEKVKKEKKSQSSSMASEPTSSASGATSRDSNTKVQRTKRRGKNAVSGAGRDDSKVTAVQTISTSSSPSKSHEIQRPSINLAVGLTVDEQNVNALSGALDRVNLYSADHEYLPSLLFVFNKVSHDWLAPLHEHRVRIAVNAYFAKSSFVSRSSPSSPSSSAIPFLIIPQDLSQRDLKMQEFLDVVLSTPAPRFRKPLNPREWLIASCWMWEIIKTSPVLAQYNTTLKQSAYGRKDAVASSSSSSAISSN